VRGLGDRFPIPVRDAAGRQDGSGVIQAWSKDKLLAPFPLNSAETFAHMRVEGTPHSWTDAQDAWDEGRMDRWPDAKKPWSMGYFQRADIPFQFALADAFTLCDAYHCSTQTGTNTNRLFLWTGTNDGLGKAGGPSISNSHDDFPEKGGAKESYTWTTYPERLLKAGVSWRIYQDMADNFTDNPLAGFKAYRDAHKDLPGSNPRLKHLALSTQHLDKLREDVLAGNPLCYRQLVHVLSALAMDFSLFFDTLTRIAARGGDYQAEAACVALLACSYQEAPDAAPLRDWLALYRTLVAESACPERVAAMRAANPVFVLRNHLVQDVIESVQAGDVRPLHDIFRRLKTPYADAPDDARWVRKCPPESMRRAGCSMLSCSS